jgi:putative transposase
MPAQIHQLDTQTDATYLREALRLLVQSLIELEVSAYIEAHHYERSESRRTRRNGFRKRSWRTQIGDITLFIPKLRKGTYYPEFLDTLRESERELLEFAERSYERDLQIQDIEHLTYRLGLGGVERSQLATIEEQLHDLARRHRVHATMRPVRSPVSALYSVEELAEVKQAMWALPGQATILDLAA